MKNAVKGYVAGLLTVILLFSTVAVFANTRGVMRELFFGVNVTVDGVPQSFEYDMRPFIMDGRVFVPVHGIADALGLDVDWDGSTQTVYIGGMPTPFVGTWLDQMGHNNYRASGPDNRFTAWPRERLTTAGDTFERGFLFTMGNWQIGSTGRLLDIRDVQGNLHGAVSHDEDGRWVSYQSMDYSLNAQYSTFSGTLVSASGRANRDNAQGAQVRIYGDGRVLYTSPPISEGTGTVDFNIDVSGVLMLNMHVSIPGVQAIASNTDRRSDITYVGIVNARFER